MCVIQHSLLHFFWLKITHVAKVSNFHVAFLEGDSFTQLLKMPFPSGPQEGVLRFWSGSFFHQLKIDGSFHSSREVALSLARAYLVSDLPRLDSHNKGGSLFRHFAIFPKYFHQKHVIHILLNKNFQFLIIHNYTQ